MNYAQANQKMMQQQEKSTTEKIVSTGMALGIALLWTGGLLATLTLLSGDSSDNPYWPND